MFDIRFKRIEAALNDARLDEAWQLLQDADVRAHNAGQKLLTRLTQAYLKRGREHLEAGNLDAAMADCGRAEKLAGNLPEIARLKSALSDAIGELRSAQSQQVNRIMQAQKHIGAGWFSGVDKILDGCTDPHAQGLKDAAQYAKTEYEALIRNIEELLENRDILSAARMFNKLAAAGGHNGRFSALRNQLESAACRDIQELLKQGQVDQAAVVLGAFSDVPARWGRLHPLNEAVFYCRKGAESLHSGQFNQAIVDLKKAQMLFTGMSWLDKVVEQVQQAARACESIEISPLGLLQTPVRDASIPTGRQNRPEILMPAPASKNNEVCCTMDNVDNRKESAKYLLQIDGVGSYIVVVGDSMTLGPISSSRRPEIGFVTSPGDPVKMIERIDGDYFLSDFSVGPQIAARPKKLLCEGERIDISVRCRMKFSQSNPASGTACLALSSAKLPRSDVQSIILFDREMILGPSRNCHIQSGLVQENLTFCIRSGKLYYQGSQYMVCDGENLNPRDGIPMGKPVEIDSLRLVWTNYTG